MNQNIEALCGNLLSVKAQKAENLSLCYLQGRLQLHPATSRAHYPKKAQTSHHLLETAAS